MAKLIVEIFFLHFCAIAILPAAYGADTCLACLHSPQAKQCRYTTQCIQGEKCYNDMYITSLGTVEYDMGCRNESQCLQVGKRSFNNLTRHSRAEHRTEVCSGCCHGNLCNAGLCGQTGFPPQTSARGPLCYSCDQQTDPDSCNIIKQCKTNEICMVHLTTITSTQRYDSTCIESHVCHNIIGAFQHTPGAVLIGRKRSDDQSVLGAGNKCLAKCCTSDLCNSDCTTPLPTTSSVKVVTTIVPRTTPTTMVPTTACVDSTPIQTCQLASAYICQNVTMATDVGCPHYCGFC